MFTSGASHRGRIDTDLYIETPEFYTHLRKRTIFKGEDRGGAKGLSPPPE